MRKFLVIAIPIVALVLFLVVMLSGNLLKYPLGEDDNIPQAIAVVIKDVNNEDWDTAEKDTDALDKAWKKIVRRVQFSSERDEINAFSAGIARLRGAIEAKDRSNALSDLYEAYEHWNQLSN